VDPSTITSFSGTLGQPNLTELVEILMGMILWGLTYVRQHVYRFVLAQAHPNEHGLENSCPSQKHVEALVLFQIPLGTAPFPSSAFPQTSSDSGSHEVLVSNQNCLFPDTLEWHTCMYAYRIHVYILKKEHM